MAQGWYVIHTYSGFENKVKASIEQKTAALGLADKISKILIPTEEVVELKKGKKKVSTRKFFPGYLLIKMEMNDDLWYLVKNIPKVTGFVGPGTKPVPISEDEVGEIIRQVETGGEAPAQGALCPWRERPHHRRALYQFFWGC